MLNQSFNHHNKNDLQNQEKCLILLDEGSKILLGKREHLKKALVCVLSGGHLLLEDIPGVGKTTLVHILGKILGHKVARIQFTNDLLPSDITGLSIFNKDTNKFEFMKGPLFNHLVLGDELNRATAKTQSALLQSMEEGCVTVDGTTYELATPFWVLATQNPYEQVGTSFLPESQLDRFFMSLSLDFPDREMEKLILTQEEPSGLLKKFSEGLGNEAINDIKDEITKIHIEDTLLEYVLDLLQVGRSKLLKGYSLSPRSGKNLVQASKGHAWISGRSYVTPEDIQLIAPHVLGHRLGSSSGVKHGVSETLLLLKKVPIK
ncbi:MAG: AAA domain-containing protein [Bacteriovoracaceae bacterium]|nr:AAA domain-containing protein [Bacteriovoracaceae bacterium]